MSERREFRPWLLVLSWTGGSAATGTAIGLAVGLFKEGGIERPIVVISTLFGIVVGLTAMVASAVLFPRLRGLPVPVRFLLLGLTLLSGSVLGTVAVLNLYPLFVFREPRLAGSVVAINGLLALIVGSVVYAYEGLRLRLNDSLREVEEVRLVEAQLREETARAELAALQARINPHFFFNTLNTIASLLEEDPEQAGEVVQLLADLFRYTFQVADAGPVRLKEEIAFSRGYLAIEQARFGKRLQVGWQLAPAALDAPVPGLLLQPLIENAVGHGIAPRSSGGKLDVACRLEGKRVVIEVVDDGVGLGDDGERLIDAGHGLGNVRRRLAAHYGAAATLTLDSNPAGPGTLARVVLPLPADQKEV